MATAVQTAPERFKQLLTETNTLHAKGVLSGDDATTYQSNVTELKALKAQIEAGSEFSDIAAFAGKSAGMLPLAETGTPEVGRVTLHGLTDAGSTKTEFRQDVRNGKTYRSFEILDQYGEGIQSTKSFEHTSSREYKDAFRAYIRRPERSLKAGELKVLQEGIDTEGGFGVPPDILERVIAKEPTPTRVAGRVAQLQTTRDKLVMPRINYTADDLYTTGMRVTWTGEIPSSSTAAAVTDPVFGQTDIPIYTAMMTINLSNDMVEDAGFPVISYVTGKFAETIDLLRDNMILNGTGQGQPSGILLNPGGTNQPAVVNSGDASDIGTDGTSLIKLSMALPEQYDDNAAFVFNKTATGSAIAQLKDGEGRFLWGSGLQDSGLMPTWKNRMLLGYPCVLSGFVPSPASNAYPIIFGDLNGYYLVNRVSFSIQVLREVYATVNQIALVGRVRFGGQVVEPWRIKLLKCST